VTATSFVLQLIKTRNMKWINFRRWAGVTCNGTRVIRNLLTALRIKELCITLLVNILSRTLFACHPPLIIWAQVWCLAALLYCFWDQLNDQWLMNNCAKVNYLKCNDLYPLLHICLWYRSIPRTLESLSTPYLLSLNNIKKRPHAVNRKKCERDKWLLPIYRQ
jgi:hypothetical protein